MSELTKIVVGIRASRGEPAAIATIESVRSHTPSTLTILLLEEIRFTSLRTLKSSQQGAEVVSCPPGGAASFNRLIATKEADVFVLLEAGALIAPGCIDHLLKGLQSDPRNGLAGPSTNWCWNAQGLRLAAATPASLSRDADEVARRFGQTTQTLEPLYSLANFCFAVRREVIDAVGPADEGYGAGPCWEMDFNIRAARAGWRGIWACAAYAYRAPMTRERASEESRAFPASKQRYQDKFCGARLRGEKADYRNHCRGDACPNFAPAAFQHRWLPGSAAAAPTPPPRVELVPETQPLVTCVMPTANRRQFVPTAIAHFLRQDYPNVELLVVDDGSDSVGDLAPPDPRIRYLRLEQKTVLGQKRNIACSHARGSIIVHWDDDDWYPSDRVTRQVAALQTGRTDISGTSHLYYYNLSERRAWLYRYTGRNRSWVAGNTLAYWKSFWTRHPFPTLQVGEDTRFVWADAAARIADLKDPRLCVAAIHSANTSQKTTVGSCWQPWPLPEILTLLSDGLTPGGAANSPPALPMVSCIMPTANRRRFVSHALRSFQQQDYSPRELIIIDDGDDNLSDLVDGLPDVRYLRRPARLSIGGKRNLACQMARGDFIAHWDDDDWYAPNRLTHQIDPLLRGDADLTGLECRFVFDSASGESWSMTPALHRRMFVGDVHGGTLVFRKSILDQGLRYPEISLAEDAVLLRAAVAKGRRLVRLPNPGLFVYVRHGSNAWSFNPSQRLGSAGWQRTDPPLPFLSEIPARQI